MTNNHPAWEETSTDLLTDSEIIKALRSEAGIDSRHFELIYLGEDNKRYYQTLDDVTEVGTLIDPDTGDDLMLVGIRLLKDL